MKLERELMRGAAPTAVLHLLSTRAMYGYELLGAIAARSDGLLSMGQSTLYPLLYNLEAKGLVTSEWRAAPSGRRRKYYTLTPRGHRRLDTDIRQWSALTRAMQALGVIARPAPGGAP